MIRITDKTLSCLDGLPHDRPTLSRFLALLVELDPGAIEMSERMFRLLSPLPEYTSYVLRIGRVEDVANYPNVAEFVCSDFPAGAGLDDRIRAEVLLDNVDNVNNIVVPLKNSPESNSNSFGGHPAPAGRALPNSLCGQNIKIKVKIKKSLSTWNDYIISNYANYAKARVSGMGGALCGDYRQTFAYLKKSFNGHVEFCPTNHYNCATALAAEWIINDGAGGNIVTSFGGVGGFAPTEEVMMILRMNGLRYADKVYDFFPEMSNLFTTITKKNVPPNKPVIGKRIFHVESSLHVDGILKQPECYEPFPPETVGLTRKIILGKQSGAASIKAKLSEFNIICGDEYIPIILDRIKNKAMEKGGAVTDREFIKIAKELLDKVKHGICTMYNDTQVATKYQFDNVRSDTYIVRNDTQVATKCTDNNAKYIISTIHGSTQPATQRQTNDAIPKRYIVDSTLRDGEQTPGLCFSSMQKIKIAELLDVGGVHQIEAGIPAISAQEKEAIVKIIENRKNAVISVWARLVPSDIEHAIDTRPDIIHVSVPVSDLHIDKKLRRDRDWVIRQLHGCIDLIAKSGIQMSAGFEDAFRSDAAFMKTAARILLDSGVTRIRLSDTVGAASPTLCRKVLNYLSNELGGRANFGIHAHNDLGMAAAITIEAAKSGCLYADATANGIGERAGNCGLARLVSASSSIFDWGMTAAAAREIQREIGKIIRHGC